jgi:cytochrome c
MHYCKFIFRIPVLTLALLLALPALGGEPSDHNGAVPNCSPEKGEALFGKCTVCHNYDSSQTHGVVGPNLHDILDRPVGKIAGYKFSSSMRKSNDIWTQEFLNTFLKEPMVVFPRTRMAFAGISNAEDRADLICFFSSNNAGSN